MAGGRPCHQQRLPARGSRLTGTAILDQATSGFAERSFSVADGTIHAEVAGSGPPVLLLHGWMLDRRLWRAQLIGLARHFTLIAIDRRGFGRSTAPAALAREPEDILAIQEQLGTAPISVVAMSQAGRIALAFAERHPEHIRALILQGIGLDGHRRPAASEQVPVARYATLARNGDLSGVKAQWLAHPLMVLPPGRSSGLLEAMVADYDGRDLLVDDTRLEIAASALSEIRTPSLIITGRQETMWRRSVARTLVRQLPRARETMIEGGHLCGLTHPETFNRAAETFLLDTTRPSSH